MTHKLVFATALLAAFLPRGVAQQPDGSDINKAIPIYFGQVATGLGDPNAKPSFVVYQATLAKGQQVRFTANTTSGKGTFGFVVYRPTALTARSTTQSDIAVIAGNYGYISSASLDYLVPSSGNYYLVLDFAQSSSTYQLSVQATGTPISIPNPQTSGCLTGRVDYMTFSLQRIAASLPDEISIGGTVACDTCSVKPPLYLEINNRLESALKLNVNVQACYDSGGNIFQIKLIHP